MKSVVNYRRLEVLNVIEESGLIPIFYHEEAALAQQILDACVKGGARVIEFTNRGDGAWQRFMALLEQRHSSQAAVMLGAGSIVDAATAALYVNSGADFIVGPMFNQEIAELCNRRKVTYIPGCGTVTEISNAEAAGVELVKIFPGDVLGTSFVRAVHGPQPWTNMIVTGGVATDKASIQEWFDAGVTAVGLGSKLIRAEWVAERQFDKISENVALILDWIAQYKSQKHNL